ncbi:ATP-binding domain-containing protein [Marinifilum fragile]|uniref:ATP-binding domain-containing protein n=1 Tax=Marinifilum fragile TaxID=570161 RepID=UPI00155DCBC5|nr:ATP-binding domain-containing protein [Marinifilum fragile]
MEGVYSNTCKHNGLSAIDYGTAKRSTGGSAFGYVCEELNKYELQQQYDYCLIDEAQDFPTSFYRVCRQIVRRNRVIWAYDDFQNILHVKMQDEKETFGKDVNGDYYIDFARKEDELQDLVLHKCYRNPRKILITAFALGLGVYNKLRDGGYQMIQRLENNEHWESLGFKVKEGDSSDGSKMVIERKEENSSGIKNSLLESNSIIRIYKAEKFREELDFIVDSILEDLGKELRPEDISVVCMDNINVKKYFDYIQNRLEQNKINCFNLLNVASNNKIYKVKDHVTLSTIYNAKGNESGKVYIAGIDTVFSKRNDITERNKIFTAMTRSVAWVTMSGVGAAVDYCMDEVSKLIENNFELVFTQPSEKDVTTIRQGIDTTQKLLNKIERLAEDLVKETGVSKDEIVDQLKLKFFKK